MSEFYMRTAICANCGKEFLPAPYHVFKYNGRYYCKWTCYNHRNITKEESAYEDNKNRPTEKI